ncbi:MAG TPA: RecX family transcriptional regulator [Chloroflexaceae bacterium]|nr:RecX family transcriptional regulator [Chloroflexaceae bacterium]
MPTGKITAIAAQAHDSQRVNLFVEGAFALGISLTTLAREGLFVGKELDEAGWARLEAAAQAEKAMLAAGRLLDARPRSAAELRQRLRRKQFPPEAVEQAVERLGELGLLDDAAFSRYWVESRQSGRPRGRLALRDELRRKGVARDTIEQALAEADAEAPPDAERERAEQVARAALRRYADSPDRASFQRRLGGLLQRRGFSLDVIRPILAILWSELQATKDQGPETNGA